jgi:hypothetical protein
MPRRELVATLWGWTSALTRNRTPVAAQIPNAVVGRNQVHGRGRVFVARGMLGSGEAVTIPMGPRRQR